MIYSLAITLYGMFGLAIAIMAWPVIRERERKRREAYNRLLDGVVHDFVRKLREAGSMPMLNHDPSDVKLHSDPFRKR